MQVNQRALIGVLVKLHPFAGDLARLPVNIGFLLSMAAGTDQRGRTADEAAVLFTSLNDFDVIAGLDLFHFVLSLERLSGALAGLFERLKKPVEFATGRIERPDFFFGIQKPARRPSLRPDLLPQLLLGSNVVWRFHIPEE